jgi:hypothetical protein
MGGEAMTHTFLLLSSCSSPCVGAVGATVSGNCECWADAAVERGNDDSRW